MRKINTLSFIRATRSTPRDINRRIALNLVREHQPISRADLARRMRIGRGVVTSLVKELLDAGAIYEGATADAPRGRRPMMLYVRTRDRLAIAIDVRFSRTYIMLGDFSANQIALESFETVFDPAELLEQLVLRIRRMIETHGAHGRCEGIGLVVPGMVDRQSGRVLNSPQLGWHDVDICDDLAERTGLTVHIENAPFACALAQMWLGQRGGDGLGDFVYVTVSDGVGAGVVVNGQIVRGHNHTAGEFGHVAVDPAGPLCLCGAYGCLEAYTSNLATVARYLGRDVGSDGVRELLATMPLTITDLMARASSGDERAAAALADTGRYLGRGLAVIINALNPSRIFIGGEITAAWDRIAPLIRAAVAERALTAAAAATPIIPEPPGSYPRLRGATALVAAPAFAAPQVA
ncbi:MAG TPA: ROK family transcriptional regulator [Gemmatimonadaceae bacterium]|nr:ROK family transcriptional regulator [Gemmatimonadaceae bacterium]